MKPGSYYFKLETVTGQPVFKLGDFYVITGGTPVVTANSPTCKWNETTAQKAAHYLKTPCRWVKVEAGHDQVTAPAPAQPTPKPAPTLGQRMAYDPVPSPGVSPDASVRIKSQRYEISLAVEDAIKAHADLMENLGVIDRKIHAVAKDDPNLARQLRSLYLELVSKLGRA